MYKGDLNRAIGIMSRVLTNGPGDRGSILGVYQGSTGAIKGRE